MEVTIDKFSTFDQVCTQAISLDFSCYDWNVPIQSAASETTTKTDWGLNNTRHTKNKSKTITTTTTFERTFQIILESLPKQFRTKKDHIEKLERIIHCLYLQKDKYLTLQVTFYLALLFIEMINVAIFQGNLKQNRHVQRSFYCLLEYSPQSWQGMYGNIRIS